MVAVKSTVEGPHRRSCEYTGSQSFQICFFDSIGRNNPADEFRLNSPYLDVRRSCSSEFRNISR